MKYIISLIRDFWKLDYHQSTYLTTACFLIAIISFNYYLDFEDSILDSYQGQYISLIYYFIYYSVPYLVVLLIYRINGVSLGDVSTAKIWSPALVMTFFLAFSTFFFHHRTWLPSDLPVYEKYTYARILNNLVSIAIFGLGILWFYLRYDGQKSTWLGMRMWKFKWRPYVIMLAIMVPLISLAATQPDFLKVYPRLHTRYFEGDYWRYFALFEPIYLMNFVFLEWFFRGVLVIGMVKYLGHRAVLPMAVLYCVIHFGKPMGECISSIFGGYLLGVFAYYSKSIWGGIIIHMGVALLMDIAAITATLIST